MTVHDDPQLLQMGDSGVSEQNSPVRSVPELSTAPLFRPLVQPHGEKRMNTDQACALLRQNWRVAGLAETTIDKRLLLFRRVGGVDATYDTVMAYLAHIEHPNTRRTAVSFLRTTFRLAVSLDVIGHDPTVLVPKPKPSRWQPRPLTVSEVDLLQSVLQGDVRDYFTLGLYAGLRACEIAVIDSSWLMHGIDGMVLRVFGKGGTDLMIPAHARIVALIESKTAGRLFPDATARLVSKRCLKAFARHGVDGGIHRARHTFAQRVLAASGGDLLTTRDLLRHASTATVQHYVGSMRGAPRRALESLT